MINYRLNALKTKMKEEGIDLYYFNTSDYHMSEYVPEYFKTIAYFSGFNGSLATLLVSLDDTYIFVDGRYHYQAEKECGQYGIKVIKLGTKQGIEPFDFILKYYGDKVIGLDGKRTSYAFAKKLLANGINIKSIDIYSELIENRACLGSSPIYELEDKYTGLSRDKKLKMVRYLLKDRIQVINNLDAIAYILNLRSRDVLYTPVFLSYLLISDNKTVLFVNETRLSNELKMRLDHDGVKILPYDNYYEYLKTIENKELLVDENKINYETYLSLNRNNNTIYNAKNVVDEMKVIKNPVEQKNIRLAHVYDGVSVVRFLKWLEDSDLSNYSEWDVSEKINSFRLNYQADDLSFNSIVSYNENGAIIHYAPTKEKAKMLKNEGTLLFDTGGQYKLGTTDITRTVALGKVDPEIKKYFTLVLKSMFNLSEIKFKKGITGSQLDILARKDLWKYGVDYRHGTGHGVGYNLGVHESPPNIRYMSTDNGSENVPIMPGMVMSDEPGVYFDDKFGIRCENLMLCVKDEENEYGQFFKFETLTLVPFDLNLIDKNYLDEETIEVINKYHQRVYNALLPYLNDEEKRFLAKLTRAI